MKKQANRLLSALLVLLMLFTLLPVASAAPSMSIVDASEEIDTWLKEQNQPEEEYDLDVEAWTAATDGTSFYRILHLDCGRKYFTPAWVKALINEMAAAGYTHLQLAFGNDGLRFLLDDMSVTANGTTYSSADVKWYIQAGNKEYYNAGDVNEWTEDEMTDIIAHAKRMGIEIIPLLNTPGHMDAILNAAEGLVDYGAAYYSSDRTIDVTNEEVVAFTQALVGKYINYFAGKGCKLFNIGADEYANDVYTGGSMGFGHLQSNDKYGYFIKYVNELAALVKTAGMKPVAFNDGIEFANVTSASVGSKTYTFDKDIIISYWSSGWPGYSPRSAADFVNRFSLINTNGAYYYVLGKTDKYDEQGDSYALKFYNTAFEGSTVSNPIGSTFCIWSDVPGAESETEIASNVRMILRMMAARMRDTYEYDGEDVIVSGGFNADGSINKNEPVVPVAFPENAGVAPSIKAGETANYRLDAPAVWTSSDENVLSLTVADTTNAAVTASSVQATAHAAGTTTVTAALTDGTAIYETKVTVTSDSTDPTEPDLPGLPTDYKGKVSSETVTGATYYELINGASAIVSGDTYLVLSGNSGKPYMLTTDAGAQRITTNIANSRVTDAVDASCEWTLTGNSASGFTMKSSSGYMYPSWNELTNGSTTANAVTITGTSSVTISRKPSGTRTYYIHYIRGFGMYVYTSSTSPSKLYLFHKVVEPAGTVWKVSTAGLEKLIVDNNLRNLDSSLYTTDSWSKFSAALDDANSYIAQYGNNSNAAFFTDKGPAVAAQTKINESALNLFNAWQALVQDTTLTIEYWITNSRLKGTESQLQYCTVSSTMGGIASEQGVATVNLVDAHGTKDGREQEYWWSKLLDTTLRNSSTSGTEQQTTQNGDDETLAGTEFTRVRYMDGKWQVYTTEWVDVDLARHQLVAYYMEVLNIANENGDSELHANIADWGARGDGGTFGYNYTGSTCTVSIQVVYEDSSTNPADESSPSQMKSKTYVYGYWDGGRGLGTLRLFGGVDYKIFKVTATTGTSTCTKRTDYTNKPDGESRFTLESLTWKDNEVDVWSGDPTDSVAIGNPTRNPRYDSFYDHLAWNTDAHQKNNAILIRVYVKNIPNEDSLKIHYIEQTSDTQFYEMSYKVAAGVVFNSNFALDTDYTDIDKALSNNTVPNPYNDGVYTVQADLGQLTEIGANYRYNDYRLVEATRSDDGKEVYLYYTFNNTHNFVVDFGAPIEITRQDINVDGEWTSATVTGAQYGTATVGVNRPLVYTPNGVLNQPETLTVSLQNADGTGATHIIHIIPASNVLYEETFFTRAAGTYTAWNQVAPTTTATQSADQTTRYGYDDIYANGTGNSMASSYRATLNQGGSTNDLTTTFTGTAFDLIGTCGPDTGYVYLKIVDAAGHGRAAVIDTSYSGDYGTLYQVPLAHLVMGNTNKDYTVTVFGAYRKVANATGNTASVMRARSYAADGLDAIYDRLADDGFAPDEVEYIYFDASSELAQMDNATFAALDMADAMTDGTVAPMASNTPGSKVEIDGFRVYRTTDSTYYSVSERGMTYARMLDMVDDNFTAYVENDGTGTWSLSNYEANGGPQNEIYLDKNGSVVLNTENMTSLQITARVASETGSVRLLVNNQLIQSIATATEMYYDINVENIDTLTISTDSNDVLLGLANIKYKGEITPVTQANIDEAIALLNSAPVEPEPVEPEPTVFTPERFDADIHVTRAIFRKYVTVSVKTSLDVAYITVNGQRVDPINNRWFSWGANGTRSFTYRDTIGRNDSVAYEVIAYDADGNASEPIILH